MPRTTLTNAQRWERQFNDWVKGRTPKKKDVEALAIYLNCAPITIYKRKSGEIPWKLEDALATLEYFGESPQEVMR